jgi:hypothetical protein
VTSAQPGVPSSWQPVDERLNVVFVSATLRLDVHLSVQIGEPDELLLDLVTGEVTDDDATHYVNPFM